jgi:hypothetical protein
MRKTLFVTLVFLVAILPGSARAEFQGWGPRVGMTVNPDQVHFGAHFDLGSVGSHVRFQPSLEMGVGDELTLLAMNGDFSYRFASRWDAWGPYLGGGMSLFVVGSDETGFRNGSDTQAGLSALGGIERGLSNGSRFFLEGKLGFIDAPDFKFTAGWTFHP